MLPEWLALRLGSERDVLPGDVGVLQRHLLPDRSRLLQRILLPARSGLLQWYLRHDGYTDGPKQLRRLRCHLRAEHYLSGRQVRAALAWALGARIVLAAVFAVAGIAKLADGPGTRKAIEEFTGAKRLVSPLAVVLPLVELAMAALLLPATTAVVGAAGAFALLALFTVAIAVSLARGRAPECHCFGQLHSAPASGRTLARNATLLAVAGLALAAGREGSLSAVAWIGRLDATALVALAAGLAVVGLVVGGSLAFLSLLRSYGQVLVRLDRLEQVLAAHGLKVERAEPQPEPEPEFGLAPGTTAPAIAGLNELLAPGRPVLLLFVSPHCGPCKTLLPRAAAWQLEHAAVLTVAFAVDGTPEEIRAEVAEHELVRVLRDDGRTLYAAFQANGTPSAVLISADGRIASWVASGPDAIERLVRRALVPPPGLPVGAVPPDIELNVLDGKPLRLNTLRGRDTLLLFWSPSCGFCRTMRGRLRDWETTAHGSPRLVVVSSGREDETRAEGFSSTVVLDSTLAVGNAFGAAGTPMAVLLDRAGRVSTPLAAGEHAVFSLLAR